LRGAERHHLDRMRIHAILHLVKNHAFSAILAGFASFAAADCPAPTDHRASMKRLLDAVKIAPNETAVARISNDMWALWADAPDDRAQQMLDDGMARRSSFDFAGAIKAFEQLIAYCPDYAEGYNQRAFVLFLREDYEPALIDLDRAIDRSPTHIAAIAGKALTLIGMKRDADAQKVLRKALTLNPWLKERQFLTGDAPTAETDL